MVKGKETVLMTMKKIATLVVGGMLFFNLGAGVLPSSAAVAEAAYNRSEDRGHGSEEYHREIRRENARHERNVRDIRK